MKTKTTRESILEAVAETILKNRQDIYGPPEDSFAAIADLWTVYLSRHKPGPLAPHDVAAMMSLLKIARIMAQPTHADNWVDLTGYSACGGELAAFFAALQNQNVPQVAVSEGRSNELSLDEVIEVSRIAHSLNSSTLKSWEPIETALIEDAILRPTTLKYADLNKLRNLAKR